MGSERGIMLGLKLRCQFILIGALIHVFRLWAQEAQFCTHRYARWVEAHFKEKNRYYGAVCRFNLGKVPQMSDPLRGNSQQVRQPGTDLLPTLPSFSIGHS